MTWLPILSNFSIFFLTVYGPYIVYCTVLNVPHSFVFLVFFTQQGPQDSVIYIVSNSVLTFSVPLAAEYDLRDFNIKYREKNSYVVLC